MCKIIQPKKVIIKSLYLETIFAAMQPSIVIYRLRPCRSKMDLHGLKERSPRIQQSRIKNKPGTRIPSRGQSTPPEAAFQNPHRAYSNRQYADPSADGRRFANACPHLIQI